ncbi:MAG TPA: hypothetical protein VI007_11690 [bacterium]
MADRVRLVEYYYIQVPDKAGEGIKALRHLQQAGVNLLAFHAFPAGRRAQLDLVPSAPSSLKSAARAAKWKLVGPKKAFLITGDDRTGALVDPYQRLADAKVNVTAASAVSAGTNYAAVLWVGGRDVKKAAKVLGAA